MQKSLKLDKPVFKPNIVGYNKKQTLDRTWNHYLQAVGPAYQGGGIMDLIAEKFPKNVESAVEILVDKLTPTPRDKVKFANMSKRALVGYHKSIKSYIVTEFRLPGNEHLMKSCSLFADLPQVDSHQASYIILNAMQMKLLETAFLKVVR